MPTISNGDISAAEKIIGYEFSDKELLMCALTHKSYANECGGDSNGRLEYLGDSILNFIVAEYLYKNISEDEGCLTDMRQKIVSETPLAVSVKEMGLLKYYKLGKGARMELKGFGDKPTSDVFEAVLGAIYLDGGMQAAREFVTHRLLNKKECKLEV